MFLGSTWEDLQDERRAVRDAILNIQANHEFPLVAIGMEDFGPSPMPPLHVCLEKVLLSHVYVGIIGHKYGSRPPGREESYTELEFQAANGVGIPCFIFLKQQSPHAAGTMLSCPQPISWDEAQAVASFRDKVSQGRVIKSFKSPEELKTSFLSYMPSRFQEIFASLRKWWPSSPGALHHGPWLDHLTDVLIQAEAPSIEFILQDAGLASPVSVLPETIATREATRAFILSFIVRASSPDVARSNLIRFAKAVSHDPSVAAHQSVIEGVIWELSGEAERACHILFSDYRSEEERVEALFAYIAEHSKPLKQAFGVPGAMNCEVLVARKLLGALGILDFIVISQTTLEYRLELVKLLTSNTEAIDPERLLECERNLSEFAKRLQNNPGQIGAIELLLDHSLRLRGDQGRVNLASNWPLSSSSVHINYHVLVGQRRDLISKMQRLGYHDLVKRELGVETRCVSYDRFLGAMKAYEGEDYQPPL